MVPSLSSTQQRKVFLDCKDLNEQEQTLWFRIIALAVDISCVPVELEITRTHATPHAIALLEALSQKLGRLSYNLAEVVKTPYPGEAFAFIAGTEVFSHKLLAGVPNLYIEPRTGSMKVKPSLLCHGLRIGVFDSSVTLIGHGKEVALISSVYDADRFLHRFLENSSTLKNYKNFEHFLIRPASPGNEHSELMRYVRSNPETAVYINLLQDPGLYDVWNYAIQIAGAKHLSTANIDDQRAPEHTEHLATLLASDDTIDVASSALRVTVKAHTSWEISSECPVMFKGDGVRRYTASDMLNERRTGFSIRDFPHCMPVWRRSLHVFYGYFNELLYGPSADSEFWLRAGSKGAGFALDGQALGLYLNDDQSYWSRNSKIDVFTDRVRQSNTDTSETFPVSMYLNEIRQLFYGAAYLELCGRLIFLSTTLKSASEIIDRLSLHYLGSGKETLLSIDMQGTPSELMRKLHTALKSTGKTISPDEPVAYRVIHGALCELEDLLF